MWTLRGFSVKLQAVTENREAEQKESLLTQIQTCGCLLLYFLPLLEKTQMFSFMVFPVWLKPAVLVRTRHWLHDVMSPEFDLTDVRNSEHANTSCFPVFWHCSGIFHFHLKSCSITSLLHATVYLCAHPAPPAEPASDSVIQYFSQYFFEKKKKVEKKKYGKNYWVKYH